MKLEKRNFNIFLKPNVKTCFELPVSQFNICKEQGVFTPESGDFFMYRFFYNQKGELNLNFYNKYRNNILKIIFKPISDVLQKVLFEKESVFSLRQL